MKYSKTQEENLIATLHEPRFANDPYAFVMFIFPWGKPGGRLERFTGPRTWQANVLKEIAEHIQANNGRLDIGFATEVFRKAVASGRGIGKSALVSWLCLWMMSTRIGSTTMVSANTKSQLETKTFPEIRKWFSLALNAHWFELLSTTIRPTKEFGDLIQRPRERGGLEIDPKYYYVEGALWSEENPDAYAGAHSDIGLLLIFDEASGIPTSIWHVARWFFSDEDNPDRYWLAFSNARNNFGGFYDCFHDPEESKHWHLANIDSRTVEGTDKAEIDRVIRQFGIDHDMTRVEILGLFPKQGADQFISTPAVQAAMDREITHDPGAPLIMGVDVARFGDDKTVVRFRQGSDARSIPSARWGYTDLVTTADRVAVLIDEYRPDAVCIDHGMGAGVIDILRRKKYVVHEIHFGASPDSDEWFDKRTEMYGRIREWLPGGALDKDSGLLADLTAAGYEFKGKGFDKVKLESKDSFKAKLGRSPDDSDALALTFAVKVSRRDTRTSRYGRQVRVAAGVDYRVLG